MFGVLYVHAPFAKTMHAMMRVCVCVCVVSIGGKLPISYR